MELKDQCVSLELAKKLKELGFKQESLFYWVLFHGGVGKGHSDYERSAIWELRTKEGSLNFQESRCPAYTVAELGEMLPQKVCWRGLSNNGSKWGLEFGDFRAEAETEADARAKMLIHLSEQGLITL